MKIWNQYGSEHSANLVMIGHFKNAGDASKAEDVIDAIRQQVMADEQAGRLVVGSHPERFGNEILALFERLNISSVAPQEVEQFAYEVSVRVEGDKVVVTTDEMDISAFLKVLFLQGARIEIYSAHDHAGTGYGRGA